MKKIIEEFKKFITRGNVLDLAVGVIVGSAFTGIVNSLVNNILTPIIGLVLGGVNFSGLSITIGEASIMYGAFIQSVIDFLITAFCIFIIVKFMNKLTSMKKVKEEKKEEEKKPAKPADVELLEEIRDLLKDNKAKTKKATK